MMSGDLSSGPVALRGGESKQHTTPPAGPADSLLTALPQHMLFQVSAFARWDFRLRDAARLSKSWRRFTQDPFYAEFLCIRLREEHCVFVPVEPPPSLRTWTALFDELYPMRNMWEPTAQHVLFRKAYEEKQNRERFLTLTASDDWTSVHEAEEDHVPPAATAATASAAAAPASRYNVGVCIRFRPAIRAPALRDTAAAAESKAQAQDEAQAAARKARFLLPLHQRLHIIKTREKCTTKQAIKRLQDEGGWFDSSWKKKPVSADGSNKENSGLHDGAGSQDARVQTVDPGRGLVVMVAPSIGMRPFTFDHVLEGKASQANAYDVAARRLVMDMCNGFNSSIIMYGQTGSGKTYTCFGPDAGVTVDTNPTRTRLSRRGLVQRACEEVFRSAEERRARGIACTLYVSFVEVYGQEVTDLLRGGQRVGHNKVSSQRYVMSGQARNRVDSLADIAAALATGDAQKRRAATAMNDRSSRAHSLFVLSMEMKNAQTGVELSSQMILADLGGSEQVKRSKVDHGGYDAETGTALGFQLGDNMREAVNINLGLLALKKCISALNDGASYVPYQDSKLTMLLSPALGGDSKATVMVCASKENVDAVETLQALRFGEKCSLVENAAGVNSSAIADIIAEMDAEIAALEATILRKERWESRETVRRDALVEAGTYEAALAAQKGGEVVRTGVVVGAEAERARLEEVIVRRAELTGEDVDLKLAEAGFGGQYGKKAQALAGNAQGRFAAVDTQGLKIKGKKVAEWRM